MGPLQFTINDPNGQIKQYTIRPLEHERAMWIYHTTLQLGAKALAKGIMSASVLFEEATQENLAKALPAIGEIMEALDYKTVMDLAKTMLSGSVIRSGDDTPIMDDLCIVSLRDWSDAQAYYRQNPIEVYLATFKAINANYPAVFTDLLARIRGFIQSRSQEDKQGEPRDG